MATQLLATAAAVVCVTAGSTASAQTVATSYSFTGVVDGDAANPFNGSFSLLNTAGSYSLTALSANYRAGSFTVANSGVTVSTGTNLFIGGSLNGIAGVTAGTDDFRFTFNPVTGAGSNTGNFVATAQNNLLSSVTLSFAAVPTMAAAAPEPAAWGMLILGFGVVGAAMRRRGKVAMRVAYTR